MIDDDFLIAVREALGIEFCRNHHLDKQAISTFADVIANKFLDKEIPAAYAAGFICAGGEPNEAYKEGEQHLEFLKSRHEQ